MSPTATAAYFLHFFIAVYLFSKLPVRRAVLHVLLSGWLFLPEKYQFVILPGLPIFDKDNYPILVCVVLNFFFGRRFFKLARLGGSMKFIIWGCLLCNIPRVLMNVDPLFKPGGMVAGVPGRSAITFAISDGMWLVVPICVGVVLASRREWLIETFRTWFSYMLIYCAMALWELRFSPQIHTKLYGYFQHSFDQMVRQGGYRPIIFMEHALAVGLYFYVSSSIAFLLRNEDIKVFGLKVSRIAAIGGVVTLLTKCMAAFSYFLIAMGTMLLKGRRVQTLGAAILATTMLCMPALRASNALPLDDLLHWATDRFGEERAFSLSFRFNMEEAIVKTMVRRKWFGYGGIGRVLEGDDPSEPEIVVDSAWIITWAERGQIGYLFYFGVLTWPLLRLGAGVRRAKDEKDKRLLAGFGFITALVLFDLMVNGLFNPITVLLTGIVWGIARSDWLRQGQAATSAVAYGGYYYPSYAPLPNAPNAPAISPAARV